MSTEIEQRIVQMKFDNKSFENNTRETLRTLDILKQKLRFDDVKNSFNSITAAAGKVDLAAITDGVQDVRMSFSGLEVFAFTAFQRISNAAITMGKNLVTSFTIDPIKSGFSEYETKMGSIQTILANTSTKGTTLEDVNKALMDLNLYADKTIYNFQEMTRNIGTFTAAGVDLDTSTKAIKGIANLAAVSGSTSQQASTAMYQLSQALSSGTVKLQDWNSVVNAGMGGEVFQNALIETAELHGINVRQMIAEEGSFRETLSKNAWLTSDVLTETLEKFTGDLTKEQLMAKGYTDEQAEAITNMGVMANDAATKVKTFTQLMDTLKEAAQSGWAETWELLVGDFEEAKALYTTISDTIGGIIGASAEARNALIKGWKELGGREELLKGFSNIITNIGKVLGAVGEAFREVFPRKTADQVFSITKAFRELTDRLMLSENAIKSIKMIAKAVFSVGKIITTVIALPLKFIPSLIESFDVLLNVIVKILGPIGSLISGIVEFATSSNILTTIAGGIAWALEKVVGVIGRFIDKVKVPLTFDDYNEMIPLLGKIRDGYNWTIDSIKEFASKSMDAFAGFDWNNVAQSMSNGFETMKTKASETWTNLKQGLYKYFTYFKENVNAFIEWVDWDKLVKAFTGIVSSKIFLDLASFLKNIGKGFGSMADNISVFMEIGGGITDSLDALKDSLSAWQDNLKADTLKKLAMAVVLLAGSIYIMASVDTDKLIVALAGVGAMLVSLIGALTFLDLMEIEGTKVTGLLTLSAAVVVLAKAVKMLGDIEPARLAASILAIGTLMLGMLGYALVIEKNNVVMDKATMTTIAFATGMVILTAAVLRLTEVDYMDLAVAILGIVALTAVFAGASKLMAGSEASNKASFKMVALASSIKEMSKAVKIMADIPFTSMTKGLLGVMALMGGLVLAMKYMDNVGTVQTAIGLIILSGALVTLAGAVKLWSMISWTTMVDGLAKVGLLLTAVGAALRLMPLHMVSIGAGLLLVSGALFSISASVLAFGMMDWWTIIKGIVGLGGSLTVLGIALNLMVGTVTGSYALMVASGALMILAGSMAILGALNLWSVIKALIGLAGVLFLFSTAVTAMIPLSGVLLGLSGGMLAFSGALLVFGAALTLIGVGMAAFAAGLIALGGALVGGVNLIVETLEHMISAILKVLPKLTKAIGAIIGALIEALANCSGELAEGLAVLLVSAIDALVKITPKLVDGILVVLDSVLASLVKYAPTIAKNFAEFWISAMNSVSEFAGPMIEATLNMIVSIFKGVLDALKNLELSVIIDAIVGATLFAAFVGFLSLITPLIPSAMAGILGMGLLIVELVAILALIGGIYQIPGFDWLLGEGKEALAKVGEAIGAFFGGIVGGLVERALSVLPAVGKSLSEFSVTSKPFFDSLNTINHSSVSSMQLLADAMMTITGAGLLNSLTSFLTGGNPLVKFGEQLAEFAPHYASYARQMRGVDSSALETTSMALKSIGEFAKMAPRIGGLGDLFMGEFSLAQFGAELSEFAPYIKSYTEQVKGIDTSGVEASTNAGKMIAAMADEIPNAGGALGWMVGENGLAQFGMELAMFAPYIKEYSESVKGIDTSGVEASTNAGRMIAEMADTLPNSGGAIAWIAGDNTLSAMAKEMCEFGPSLMKYAKSVEGLSVNAISESVRAANKMVELTSAIPDDVELKGFGKELVTFGGSMAKYFNNIEDVDMYALDSSIFTVTKLMDMMRNLTGIDTNAFAQFTLMFEQAGVEGIQKFIDAFGAAGDKAPLAVNKFIKNATDGMNKRSEEFAITGENMMKSLTASLKHGMDLALAEVTIAFEKMGVSVQNAANSTQGATTKMLDSMVSTLAERSTSVAESMASIMDIVGNSILDKVPVLNETGSKLVLSVRDGIQGEAGSIKVIMDQVLSNSIVGFEALYPTYLMSGSELLRSLSSGMRAQLADTTSEVGTILTTLLEEVHSRSNSFVEAGMVITNSLIRGLTTNTNSVINSAKSLSTSMLNTINNDYGKWVSAGKYLVQGFANGISGNTYLATAKAAEMARQSEEAAKRQLQIHSPSRVGGEIGMYFVEGFANGIEDNMSESTDRSSMMAKAATDALSTTLSNMESILNEDMDYQPVITPVLDLSDVNANSKTLDTLFSRRSAVSLSAEMNRSHGQNDSTGGSNGSSSSVSFVQNNYSPKSLSSAEIYRQTKNQFSRLKGLANV